MLELEGRYVVQTADGLASAEESAREFHPDIAIVDIRLGAENGLELISYLKSRSPDVVCIVLTAFRDPALTIDALRRQADDFVYKPLASETLLRLLQRHVTTQGLRRERQEFERRFRAVFDQTRRQLYLTDTEGSVVELNHRASEFLGAGREALSGQLLWEALRRNDGDAVGERLRDAVLRAARGLASRLELRLHSSQGRGEHWFEVSASPVRGRDACVYLVLLELEDITQRIQADGERRRVLDMLQQERRYLEQRVAERTAELEGANKDLAEAAKAKDDFMATMSHELRTPLTSILGIAEALESTGVGELTSRQLELLSGISASGQHLLELINEVLDLAKGEAGQLALDWTAVDVHESIREAIRLVEPSAKAKGLDVSLQLDPELGLLRADRRRLKQILVNLLDNAVKFTPEGGSLGLAVTAEPVRGHVCFCVWDTGIGIERKHQQKLFQPFQQVDSKLSRAQGGTGLGLALVQKLVLLHGGAVELESEPGVGTRVCVFLPWTRPGVGEAAGAGAAATESGWGDSGAVLHRRRILVAEDNPTVALLLTEYLRSLGYDVDLANNGAEALEKAAALDPDLILMDVQMPVMDGLEATRRLKADSALASIPVAMLSAFAMTSDRKRCTEAGADGYISKPIKLQELAETLRSYLR
jgi:PAS domain S-box-containing protein